MGDQVFVRGRPELVALLDGVFEAEHVAPVLDQVRRPRAEVLDAHRLDTGVMDVDPVVVPRDRLGRNHQCDRQEVPVVEIGGGRCTSTGAGGSIAINSCESGIEETTAEARYSVWPPSLSTSRRRPCRQRDKSG